VIRALVAEFDDADRFLEALHALKKDGLTPFDALAPFHLEEAVELGRVLN
jgi:hypothetical protein